MYCFLLRVRIELPTFTQAHLFLSLLSFFCLAKNFSMTLVISFFSIYDKFKTNIISMSAKTFALVNKKKEMDEKDLFEDEFKT